MLAERRFLGGSSTDPFPTEVTKMKRHRNCRVVLRHMHMVVNAPIVMRCRTVMCTQCWNMFASG
jgi:hypothetical protein